MPEHVEFIDDLLEDDMQPARTDAIAKEAAARLVSQFGVGLVSVQTHEDFTDGYNWIRVALVTPKRENPL